MIHQDPLSGHLFAFFNRPADRLKILYWDRSGFCLWYKRLERGMFHLPRAGVAALELDAAELTLLLDGIDLSGATRRARFMPRVGVTTGM
jgi:transposase